MYKFPIRIPRGMFLTLAQSFRADTQIDFSEALSKATKSHNGVDVVCGSPQTTWGKICVWPFPWPGVVYDAQVDSLFGATQHAHSQIDTTDPTTGIQYSLIYIHLSKVTQTKSPTENKVIIYNQGDTIGNIGNNGFVNPAPTPERPFDGSHLHLGLGVKNPGQANYTMVDPLTILDINNPFIIETSLFKRDLFFGLSGEDVRLLQRLLGLLPKYQTGWFGPITLRTVVDYQKSHNISPTLGYVGTKTRSILETQFGGAV
mgnify:FL=1